MVRKQIIVTCAIIFLLTGSYDTEAKTVYVREPAVHLRSEQSTLSNVVTILGEDDKLEIIEEHLSWYKVKTTKGVGWIAQRLVTDKPPLTEEIKFEKKKSKTLSKKITQLQSKIDEIDQNKKQTAVEISILLQENKKLLAENERLNSAKDIIRAIIGVAIFVFGWLFGFLTGFYKKQSDNKHLESLVSSSKFKY